MRRALNSSVQLPHTTTTSHAVDSEIIHVDFTEDLPTNVRSGSISPVGSMVPSWRLPPCLSTDIHCTSTHQGPSSATARSSRWSWFNPAAVLHDVRPSARYIRQDHSSSNNGNIHATVTVDGQRFQGFGATWKQAKRSAAAQALRHILHLNHLTADF